MIQGGDFMVGSRCQDCGNQAKKECVYMRCRTCCKNKGFLCQTHLKSTWVPAYRRRQRHHHNHNHNHNHLLQLHNPKRHRQEQQQPLSGLEEVNFPAEVNSMATFHCVRVSSVDDGVDQYAYQTSVNIGGHIFKGILYDQGPSAENCYTAGESTSGTGGVPNFVDAVALTTGTTTSTAPARTAFASASASAAGAHQQVQFVNASSYPFPLDASFSGMQFFPNRKS